MKKVVALVVLIGSLTGAAEQRVSQMGCVTFYPATYPKRGYLEKFALDTGSGKVELRRGLWANTTLFTGAGKKLEIVDPFMYCTVAVLPDGGKVGGYWSRDEVFDRWMIREIPGLRGVEFAAVSEEGGLRKRARLSLEPDGNVVYVTSVVEALADLTLESDRGVIYLKDGARDYELNLDGAAISHDQMAKDKALPIRSHIALTNKTKQAGFGLCFLGGRSDLGEVVAVQPPRAELIPRSDGALEISWYKAAPLKLKAGDTVSDNYVLFWGDGSVDALAAKLAEQARTGSLVEKFSKAAQGRNQNVR